MGIYPWESEFCAWAVAPTPTPAAGFLPGSRNASVVPAPSPRKHLWIQEEPNRSPFSGFSGSAGPFPPGAHLCSPRQSLSIPCFPPLWALGKSRSPSSGHYRVSLLGHRWRGTDFSASSLESMKGSAEAWVRRSNEAATLPPRHPGAICPAVSSLPDIKQRGNQGFLNWGS